MTLCARAIWFGSNLAGFRLGYRNDCLFLLRMSH